MSKISKVSLFFSGDVGDEKFLLLVFDPDSVEWKVEKSKTRLYVYSQEFKLWNYSDGERAHYVKIRLGV